MVTLHNENNIHISIFYTAIGVVGCNLEVAARQIMSLLFNSMSQIKRRALSLDLKTASEGILNDGNHVCS